MTATSPYLKLVPRTECEVRKAMGLPHKKPIQLSIHARAEQNFPRQQSISMRELPWEDRARPLEPMWKSIVTLVFLVLFFIGAFVVTGMFGG